MTNVVPIRRPQQPPTDELTRFHIARREMNRAFAAWLATRPSASDAQAELDGTMNSLGQIWEAVR